jgi:hypothetical protein
LPRRDRSLDKLTSTSGTASRPQRGCSFGGFKREVAHVFIHALGLKGLGDAIVCRDWNGDLRLVDAGKLKDEAARRLLDLGVTRLRAAVCTHCDDDHIGGMPEVLQQLTVDELWLPASWGDVLVGAVTCPEESRAELLSAQLPTVLDDADSDLNDAELIDRWADEGDESFSPWFEDYGVRYGVPAEAGLTDPELLQHGVSLLSDDSEMDERLRFRLEALVGVVNVALARGTRIRFFSHESALREPESDLWMTSGEPDHFTLLNAREVRLELCPRVPLVMLFRLTIQNRRAIVPIAHGGPMCRSSLLCSDSSFEFLDVLPIPWDHIGLVAAPHHGSHNTSHDALYNSALQHGYHGLWMRSHNDTTYPQWPGPRWKEIDVDRRFCTRCRGDAAADVQPQDLRFVPGPYLRTQLSPATAGPARPCRC